MSKIICDICGTSYQDTAECCPICGCSRDAVADLLSDDVMAEDILEEGARTVSRKKQIFDYDEVNPRRTVSVPAEDDTDSDYEDEEEDEEEESRPNTLVVILLTVLIAALLLAAGFIFIRYFLPNMGDKEESVPPATMIQTEPVTETTELRIPCDTLFLNSSKQAELNEAGFSHLINVVIYPENTTDQLTFVSADESIATVTADGKVTAVAEGQTVVTITCGDIQMNVDVICDFTPETEPPTEETVAATEAESVEETAAATEAEEENKGSTVIDPNIKLKLKRSDVSMGVGYTIQLQLDCDLDPKDVEWSSEYPYIAKVDEEGNVTALKSGATGIFAKYGEQQVQCIVRCG